MSEINRLADSILAKCGKMKTAIIGIDGLGGAGKSTVSKHIAEALSDKGINTVVFHIDDFIHPKSIRYNEKYPQWECYYYLQWRYDYLVNEILLPIKNGSFKGTAELYDKDNDCYVKTYPNVPEECAVILEGVFLMREELAGLFDYMIYIDVPEEIRLERVLKRDVYIGGEESIRRKYEQRYFPAERFYSEKYSPQLSADFIIH